MLGTDVRRRQVIAIRVVPFGERRHAERVPAGRADPDPRSRPPADACRWAPGRAEFGIAIEPQAGIELRARSGGLPPFAEPADPLHGVVTEIVRSDPRATAIAAE